MATADKLLELMNDWIEQREECAGELIKLAEELESLREKCNAGACVGNTVSVVGGLCLLGAGVATLFTGGAAAPLLAVAGTAYTGVGVAVTLTSKLIELLNTSDHIKKAKKIEAKSDDIEYRIRKLFEQLKAEAKRSTSVKDEDDEDRYVMSRFLEAVAKESGMKPQDIREITNRIQHDNSFWSDGPKHSGFRNPLHSLVQPTLTTGLGVLAFFTFELSGKESGALLAKGTQQILKEVSTAGLKTAFKGGAMVVGGIVGLAFALPEAIDSWTEQVEKKHETEASRSVRKIAKLLFSSCRLLKEQLQAIKELLDAVAKELKEEEEKKKKKKKKKKVIRIASVNVNALTTSTFAVHSLILMNNVDALAIQETKLSKANASIVLCQATPFGYVADHEEREERGERGGGVANIVRLDVRVAQRLFGFVTTFEYVATLLKDGTIFINVYRPPGQSDYRIVRFLEEFHKFLTEVVRSYARVVITGDFNIWVESEKRTSLMFYSMWLDYGFIQHITGPTFDRGNHTLDLLFTRNVPTENVRVQRDGVADHCTIYADLLQPSEEED